MLRHNFYSLEIIIYYDRTNLPKGEFYAFSKTAHLESSEKCDEAFLNKAKVVVFPGTEFWKHGEGFMRFSYATDYNKIETALNQIEKIVTKK